MSEQGQGKTPSAPRVRNLVLRGDGKAINVFRRPGQLLVCGFG